MTRLARRWIGTHVLARSAATRSGRAHRPAWPDAPPRAHHLRITHLTSFVLLALAIAIGGCGSEGESFAPPDYETALAGAPPELAALHEQENALLPGGLDAYESRVAELRGFPIVANVWASWCGPCRFEYPFFQRAATEYGKRVAFLGIDKEDDDDAARTFLREEPIPYPSYEDPDAAISDSIGASLGMPDTAFYDSGGELVYLKQGPYDDFGELKADIERFALAGGAESG